jgi:hypothetical protein
MMDPDLLTATVAAHLKAISDTIDAYVQDDVQTVQANHTEAYLAEYNRVGSAIATEFETLMFWTGRITTIKTVISYPPTAPPHTPDSGKK